MRLHGSIPFREAETTDLHFTIAGGPFNWSFFHLPEVRGEIHWVTNQLRIAQLDGRHFEHAHALRRQPCRQRRVVFTAAGQHHGRAGTHHSRSLMSRPWASSSNRPYATSTT